MSDKDILQDYEDAYEDGLRDWGQYYPEAYKDMQYASGDQWSDADKSYLTGQDRNAYVFNYIRRNVKNISGYQRKNRLASLTDPIEGSDQYTSDILSDLLLNGMQYGEGYNVLSDAFEHGALVTGLNLISLWMDYSEDPVNGEPQINREAFNSFMMDSQFTKLDLSDCRYLLRRKYVDKATAKRLLPGKSGFVNEIEPSGKSDTKFDYMSYARRNTPGKKLLRYDEYWRRTTKKVYLIIDGMTGQTQKWKGSKKSLDAFISQYPFVDYVKTYEPSVELSIMLEEEVMYNGPDPYGLNDYPFIPVVGFYTPEYDDYAYKLQGIVRTLRDPQTELNRMESKSSDIIKGQVNSGWDVEENQVVNEEDLYRTGQGVVIKRKAGTAPLVKIQPAELSQAFPLMIESYQRDISQLAGGSEELFGVAEGGNTEVSGTLAKQRAANALTTFQDLFDNLSLSQKFLGEKYLKMVLSNWTPEKIQRVTGKEVPPNINDIESLKYDVVVKEGLLTDTQRNLQYLQMLEAIKVGVEIPQSALIRAIPIADKTELLKDFEQEQQQKQEAQAKIDEQEQMVLKMQNAKIVADLSLAEERRARAKADVGLLIERTSESVQNQSEAVLNQVKAAGEIMGMRQDQLIGALTFVLQLQEKAEAEDKQREMISSIEAESVQSTQQ